MTIFFDGHSFKYEVEGVCKLFFPLMRFTHVYCNGDADFSGTDGDYAATVRRSGGCETVLSVEVRLSEIGRAHV